MFNVKEWEKRKIEELVEEIRIEQRIIAETKSKYLIADRTKSIKAMKKDLEEFCEIRELNYEEIEHKYGI